MQKDIHPQYNTDAEIKCACGRILKAGSTVKEMSTDTCSQCHPFFTGKANIVDTDGIVDKFKKMAASAPKAGEFAKAKKAKEAAKKAAKKEKGLKAE